MPRNVFLGMPHYCSQVNIQSARAFFVAASKNDLIRIRQSRGCSLLAKGFNLLWACALNAADEGTVDTFVMIHADVIPEDGFVDTLCDLLDEHEADVMSVAIPIKSRDGMISIAVDSGDKFHPARRLTMHELASLPDTFGASDVDSAGDLLVNTGCFAARLDAEWCTATTNGRLNSTFTIDDEIRYKDGSFQVATAPEDWQWSRMANAAGAKVMATKAIHCVHHGEVDFPNRGVWGHKHDPSATTVVAH